MTACAREFLSSLNLPSVYLQDQETCQSVAAGDVSLGRLFLYGWKDFLSRAQICPIPALELDTVDG